jgi:hypothetical protein
MLSQTTSDAVIVSLRRPLSWANTVTWPVRLTARLVRIEGVRGSNPLSSTHVMSQDIEDTVNPRWAHGDLLFGPGGLPVGW